MTPTNSAGHAAYAYVRALVDGLVRAGVRHACICPGSRSTPLALSLAAHPAIKHWMHVDERSAAFFALGLAKVSCTPVALICTSGTAAANFLPAVVEARYGRVPLVVLTADRPPELRDNGAPQAIDQMHLYGDNVKWFVEMALPEATDTALRYAGATGARAGATAVAEPAGPVHVNCPYREPLLPVGVQDGSAGGVLLHALTAARDGHDTGEPAPVLEGPRRLCASDIHNLALRLVTPTGSRGLIVCGPGAAMGSDGVASITRLAALLGFPVLADPLSGLRSGPDARVPICDAYDALLRALPADGGGLMPEVVLRFGAIPTSKALLTFLDRAAWQVVIDGGCGWRDPSARADTIVHADPALLCEDLSAVLAADLADPCQRAREANAGWVEAWHSADRSARAAVEAYLETLDEPFEGKVLAELSRLMPDSSTLFVGNSMPVRDLDTFFPRRDKSIRFLCNRGANGIDGVVSSALGAAAGSGNPLVLVIGDLSFYHDLNGLLAARRHAIDATIVLLNNDGGGIFSFLPQAAMPAYFEEVFGTPTGLDFQPVVEMYGGAWYAPATWSDFRQAVGRSIGAPGLQVIQVRTDRTRNVALHRATWEAVREAL